MKKLMMSVMLMMLVMFTVSVIAMDGPLTVQTEPGNKVKITVWLPGNVTSAWYGDADGIADENGLFSKTFFALNEETAIYQVRILSGKSIIRDEKFEKWGVKDPLLFNCISPKCSVSIDKAAMVRMEEEKKKAEAEKLAVVNGDSGNETTETNSTAEENKTAEIVSEEVKSGDLAEGNTLFTGKAILFNDNGSVRWYFLVFGGLLALLILLAIIGILKKGLGVNIEVKELKKLEGEVKNRAKEIKKIKDLKKQKDDVQRAKSKLGEEEKELDSLKREQIDGNADVQKAREKLVEEQRELNSLRDEQQ